MAAARKRKVSLKGGAVVGSVEMVATSAVQPNPWNPNRLTPLQMESLQHGLKTDGWLISQAMLVWRTDERGRPRNLIIDGEHRWRGACALGFPEVPVTFIDGLTEAQAKALTVKMDSRRGSFEQVTLRALLVEIQGDFDDPAFEFGFEGEDYARLFAVPDIEGDGDAVPANTRSTFNGEANLPTRTSKVASVQIYLTNAQKTEWDAMLARLRTRFGTQSASDTLLAAVRAVRAS